MNQIQPIAADEAAPPPEHPLRAWRLRQIAKAGEWGRPPRAMTITQAAELGGWCYSVWQYWETGKRIPGPDDMPRLCELTGLEPADFYTINGMPYSEWRRRSRSRG